MIVCYVGIGSNLGERKENIKKALSCLKKTKGVEVVKFSRIYETKPVGGPKQGKFLNAAVKLKTSLSPGELLKRLKKIEKLLGRKKTVRYGPRVIDLDILLYADSLIKRQNLKIPHPKIFAREFVLRPLADIL